MALRKPSDLFSKKETSGVFESPEVSSHITESYDKFRNNFDKVNELSEKVEVLSNQLSEKLNKSDLENAMLSQLMVLDENFKSLQNQVKGLNKQDLKDFKETVSNLSEIVDNLVETELPKYKKQITKNELYVGEQVNQLQGIVETNISGIREEIDEKFDNIADVVDNNIEYFNQKLEETSTQVKKTTETYTNISKILENKVSQENEKFEEYSELIENLSQAFEQLSGALKEELNISSQLTEEKFEEYRKQFETFSTQLETSVDVRLEDYHKEILDIKADVVINEQHIKNVDKYLQEHHQELIELKEEVFTEIEKLPVGNLQENLERLEKKIDYIKETYSQIEPEVVVKEVIREGLLNEPPDTKNSDPLTPLDQKFVTVDQLQEHYRLFLNRIQQQLSTLGGGGETRLQYLDDIVGIATNASAYDGKYLRYNHSSGKFEFEAAEVTPDSIVLGTDTTGDYVQSISGTVNQITVSGGTGESSTPVVSIASNPLLPGNVTIANDLQVNRNLNVTGNITIGGTSAYIISNDFRVKDADIVLGFTTSSNGADVSNDTTANHGGIAIASTEGTPLVQLFNVAIGETNPATYKKIMWFKSGAFTGLNTDAWLINYAVGIGSTQFPSGTRLAAGSVQFTERDLAVVRNINASGIVTAPTLNSTITNITTGNFTNANIVTGIVTNLSGTNVSYSGIGTIGTLRSNIGIITTLSGTTASYTNANIVTGIVTNLSGTNVSYSGIGTIGTLRSNIGIITTLSGTTASYTNANIVTGIVTNLSGTNLSYSGIGTITTLNATNTSLTNLNVSGVSTFTGSITGTISTATKLQNARTFEITGDVVASPIFFDGTGNVSLAATIQPNSVALGTDTTGDYVQTISGTANQITVTGGSGEGSTPTLSIPNQLTAPQDVTVSRDLQVNRNLNVNGNITIGGTAATLFTTELKVSDPDLVLGFRTDSFDNDVSNDTTANHGGIAIASTEGNPLIQIYNPGIGESTPATYKKIMWFKAGSFAGLGTDAWLINYAVGIGSTQFPSGTLLAAGNVQFTENDLAVVRGVNASGIVTGSSFRPSSGYIQAADGTNSFYIYSGNGNVAFQGTIGASSINNGQGYQAINFTTTSTPTVSIPNSLNVGTDGAVFTALSTGNVGIGTTVPTSKLHVVGDTLITGIATVNSNLVVNGNTLVADATNNRVGIGVTNPIHPFQVGAAGTTTFVVTGVGSVGIGTTNPTSALTVNGDINLIDTNPFVTTVQVATATTNRTITFPDATGTVALVAGSSNQVIFNLAGVNTASPNFTYSDTTGLSLLTPLTVVPTSTGNAGLFSGTTSADMVRITQLGTGNALVVEDETNPDSTPFVVGAAGSVGVGIANPGAKLHILGGTTTAGAELNLIVQSSNTATVPSTISASSSNATLQIFAGGTLVGSSRGSQIDFVGGGAASSPGTLIFRTGTAAGGTSQPERVRIDSSGNVGIGTANPTSRLHVVGDALITGAVTATTFSGQVNAGVGTITTLNATNLSLTNLNVSGVSTFTNGPVLIGSGTSTGTAGQVLQVTGINSSVYIGGSVGIGTTNPTSALHVIGTETVDNIAISGSTVSHTNGLLLISNDVNGYAGIRIGWNNQTSNNSIILGRQGVIGWSVTSSATQGQAPDVRLYRDDIGILALRLGATNPHSFRIYNTYTSTTNFERANVGWTTTTTNTFIVGTEKGSAGGTARQLELQTDGTTRVAITTTGNVGVGTTNPLQNLHVLGNVLVAAGTSTGQHITQKAYEVGGGTLSWEGSAGQLFSITNNLTSGSIFSVNDVSGIPSIDVNADGTVALAPFADGNVGIATTRPTSRLHVVGDALITGVTTSSNGFVGNINSAGVSTFTDIRLNSVSEKSTRVSGNTVSLVYNTGGGNIAICTNPTGPITLNVTGIPTDSSFDNRVLTFTVIVLQGSTGYACTTVNLNGFPEVVRYPGAVVSVGSTNSYDIFNFTGINTVGSASTAANYTVLGMVNGNFR